MAPNQPAAAQKRSFAGDLGLIRKALGGSGLAGCGGGCEPPRLNDAPGCGTRCPQIWAGDRHCPPTWGAVCGGCHCSAPCFGHPGGFVSSPASPVLQVEPFHGLGLVWRECESRILPRWCVSILLPDTLQVSPNGGLQPGPLCSAHLLLCSAVCTRARSFFSQAGVHLSCSRFQLATTYQITSCRWFRTLQGLCAALERGGREERAKPVLASNFPSPCPGPIAWRFSPAFGGDGPFSRALPFERSSFFGGDMRETYPKSSDLPP